MPSPAHTTSQSSGISTVKLAGANLQRGDYPQILGESLADSTTERCVVELLDYAGCTPAERPQTLQVPLKHILRCAVLGDEQIEAWHQAALAPLLPEAEIGFFSHAQLEDGWNWIERA